MAEKAERIGREADRRERGTANGRAAQQKASCLQATRRKAGGQPAAGGTMGGRKEARADGPRGRQRQKRGERTRGQADSGRGGKSRGRGARRGTQQTEQHGHCTKRCEASG